MLMIPRAYVNNAMWAANSGDYAQAAGILNSEILKNSMRSSILRLNYTALTGDHEQFDEVFDSLKKPNSEAYYLFTKTLLQRGMVEEAAETAKLCVEHAPYYLRSYELMEEVRRNMPEGDIRENYAEKISELKEKALERIHPLAGYVPYNRGLGQRY